MNSTNPPRISSPDPRYLHWKRRFAHLARWLHTYLSMLSFAILLFFAATGFTLNHADWFEGQRNAARYQGTLDAAWMKTGDSKVVEQDKIVEFLRRTHAIKGAVSEVHVDDEQCEVVFKGPGYEADASIDRNTGKYDLSVSRFGLVSVLNDLHKGRDTGRKWSTVIDFSAVLMTLVSLTGLTLIFFLNKRRLFGLLILVTGALLCYLAYAMWVS
ncbi:MAG: peptidase [Candidatus Acidoferrum typicum]|nr:peptidase [Candidatus Acidoferrum typicum]